MNKFFLTALLAFIATVSYSQVSKTVNVEEPGTLKYLVGDNYLDITNLTVTGQINGDDVVVIRAMCGRDQAEAATGSGSLHVLDLRGATIMAGGSAYASNQYSTNC